jgi:hypothetical protein
LGFDSWVEHASDLAPDVTDQTIPFLCVKSANDLLRVQIAGSEPTMKVLVRASPPFSSRHEPHVDPAHPGDHKRTGPVRGDSPLIQVRDQLADPGPSNLDWARPSLEKPLDGVVPDDEQVAEVAVRECGPSK